MAESKNVLLVEDEAIIAMDLEMSLSDLGWSVIGPAATADQALALIDNNSVDFGILDFNIRGGTSEPIARRLIEKSIPLLFLSGDSLTRDIQDLAHVPVLSKPVSMAVLDAAMAAAVGAS